MLGLNSPLKAIPLLILQGSSICLAVTLYQPERIAYTTQLSDLRPSVNLKVLAKTTHLLVPSETLLTRVLKASSISEVQAPTLKIPDDPVKINHLAIELTKDGNASALRDAMIAAVNLEKSRLSREASPLKNEETTFRFTLKPSFLRFVDLKKLGTVLSQSHQDLSIEPRGWLGGENGDLGELLRQAKPYLERETLKKVLRKVQKGQEIRVDTDLLPKFARENVGKYLAVQGPNCFHASLAFQGRELVESPYINLKAESGYDPSMINYDELWRVLKTSFYEVDLKQNEMQYGDIIVFFDMPEKATPWVNFKTIRHAATYLFDQYTFSKGSKSPDTPYSVKTLADEWSTWERFSKRLGAKVYRRSEKHVRPIPPKDLAEWVF